MYFINKNRKVYNFDELLLTTYRTWCKSSQKNKPFSICRILLKESLNNFYINIVDESGETLIFKSAGLCNKHRVRTSVQVLEELAATLSPELESLRHNNSFIICLKSPYNMKMKTLTKLLINFLGKSILVIMNQVSVPHNGVRGRKQRRK